MKFHKTLHRSYEIELRANPFTKAASFRLEKIVLYYRTCIVCGKLPSTVRFLDYPNYALSSVRILFRRSREIWSFDSRARISAVLFIAQ